MTCALRLTARRKEKSVTADMAKNAVVREIKPVKGMRGKEIGVENHDAGRAKALRGDAVAAARQPPAERDQARRDGRPDRNPPERRDEIVLEGIFHQENDAEKKRETAEPGEQSLPP